MFLFVLCTRCWVKINGILQVNFPTARVRILNRNKQFKINITRCTITTFFESPKNLLGRKMISECKTRVCI